MSTKPNAIHMRKLYKTNPAKYRKISAQNRAQRPVSANMARDRAYKNRYGSSLAEFEQLSERQHGLCAICALPLLLTVDHNHLTGQVRGLLCGNCNRGIGCMQESIPNLKSAIQYLIDTQNITNKPE